MRRQEGKNTHLATMSSMRVSATEPLLTASTKYGPQKASPLGMATSMPASAAATPACWAPQSLTTQPWKPSSVLRSPLSALLFAQPYELFRR